MCHCPRFAQAPRPPLCPAVAGTPAANLNRYVKSSGAHRLAHPAPIHTEVLRAQKPRSVQKIMYKSHSCREEDFSRMRKSKTKIHFCTDTKKNMGIYQALPVCTGIFLYFTIHLQQRVFNGGAGSSVTYCLKLNSFYACHINRYQII